MLMCMMVERGVYSLIKESHDSDKKNNKVTCQTVTAAIIE